jgi:glycosyltransferase involved in cell wall biosynthesis
MNGWAGELRVLHVNTKDMGGGAAGSAWNLFQAYRQRGFDSWLAVGRKFSENPNVLLIPNEANRPFVTRFWLDMQSRSVSKVPRRLLGWLARLGELKRLARDFLGHEDFDHPGTWRLLDLPPRPPTLVHCHNLHGRFFNLRFLPRLSAQVPVILNLRDAWLLSGHCAYSLGCRRWRSGCGHCPDLTIYPPIRRDATAYNWRRKREIYAQSRLYVTAPSRWLIDRAKESILGGVQYRVISNAIDLGIFRPGGREEARRLLGLPLNAKVVLLIAHSRFRDLEMMKAALARVRVAEAKDLLFICLGQDPAEHALGQGRIRYVGYEQDQRRVALYYKAADLYIHAALGEAFGKTIVEAMACGAPVVATAVEAIPELIEDGTTGFLVPPGDAESMSRAIERVLLDDHVQKRMSDAGVLEARERYGLERQVDSFLAWYREVLADWSAWKGVAQH